MIKKLISELKGQKDNIYREKQDITIIQESLLWISPSILYYPDIDIHRSFSYSNKSLQKHWAKCGSYINLERQKFIIWFEA